MAKLLIKDGPILGCDIGNGFGKVSVLEKWDGDPSYLLPDSLRVGMPSTAYVAPDGTIEVYGAKRKLSGRAVTAVKQKLEQETLTFTEKGQRYEISPKAVYAALARDLVTLANNERKNRGEAPIYKMVLTYPAAYKFRPDMLGKLKESVESVELEGNRLQVVGMISEPGAVAVDFLHFKKYLAPEPFTKDSFTALVYDLGHGTFDTAVVTAYTDPGKECDLVCQDGDPGIGGQNFDDALYEEIVAQLRMQAGEDATFNRSVLRSIAVEMKHELKDAPISERDIPIGDTDVHICITREAFEAMILPLLHQTLSKVVQMFEESQSKGVEVDAIVLSGGSSQIPLVRRILLEMTDGSIPVELYRPSMAVTFGAARVAWGLRAPEPNTESDRNGTGTTPPPEPKGNDVIKQYCERSCGIRIDGSVYFLLDEAQPLPCTSKPLQIRTAPSGRSELWLYNAKNPVKGAASAAPEVCDEIRRFSVLLPANTACTITMAMDESRCIRVTCAPEGSAPVTLSTFRDDRKDV